MMYLTTILCIACALSNIQEAQSASKYPKLLVVSYDGFRYDYFNRNVTLFMNNLKNKGTHADHMINAFVTKTFPNHHTIATGFYVETHGVLDATVMEGNKTIYDSAELFTYNKNILPIWTMNEKQGNGRHSGVAMWPGSQYNYNGTVPEFLETFNVSVPWKVRIDKILSWFTHPSTPINFGMLYIEEPDLHGHAYGINAPIINEMLKKLDNITKYLHDKLEENNLGDVNVVHLSDHGMVSVTLDRIVNITSYIGNFSYKAVSKDMIMLITPDSGNEDLIYQKLKAVANETSKFEVYKHKDIPKRYHFSNNPRIGDILVSAKNGYALQQLYNNIEYYKKAYNVTVNNQSEFGIHGYDNQDPTMHPIFFAQGPAFLSHCELEPFNTVDLFPLFCKILELNCYAVNGTAETFSKCLTSPSGAPTSVVSVLVIVIFCLFAIIGISAIVIYFIRRRRKQTRLLNRRLYNEQLWEEIEENC